MICFRCNQRGERYSRQLARDGGLRFSSKWISIFAAKAGEVKKRAGRCIGKLMEEDRKRGGWRGWRDKRQQRTRQRGKVISSLRSNCRALLPFVPAPCPDGNIDKNPLALQSNRPRDLLDCTVLLDVRIHEGGELSIGKTGDAVVGRLCLQTYSECFPLFIAKVAEVGAKVQERKMGYR
jgi:hypothetical protein